MYVLLLNKYMDYKKWIQIMKNTRRCLGKLITML